MTTETKMTDEFAQDLRHLIVMDTQCGWSGSTTLRLPEIERLVARGWVAEGYENAEYDLTDEGRAIIAARLRGEGKECPVSLNQRATAWDAVVDALDELAPGWTDGPGTGIESAIAAIRGLATRRYNETLQVAIVPEPEQHGQTVACYLCDGRGFKYSHTGSIGCEACNRTGVRPQPVVGDALRALIESWDARAKAEHLASQDKNWAEWLRDRHHGASGAFSACKLELEAALGQQPVAGDAVRALPSTLRAMAMNYMRGEGRHRFDHLDADVCKRAADAIDALSAAPAAPEAGKVVVREAALRLAIRELNHARKGVDSAGRANYVHRLLLAMLDEEPIHDVAEPAAPAPVAGDAVAALPAKWREQDRSIAGLVRDCADELDAAFAQDRASQGAVAAPHADDVAVDRFAAAMKEKLSAAREKGRGGWENREDCPQQRLSDMLRAHVEKGDPRDVANFCMMLHQRGESILPQPEAAPGVPEDRKLIAQLREYLEEINADDDGDDYLNISYHALKLFAAAPKPTAGEVRSA